MTPVRRRLWHEPGRCRWLVATLGLTGCGNSMSASAPTDLPAGFEIAQRITLSADGAFGVSGLCADPDGRVYAIPERSGSLIEIDRRGAEPVVASYPLRDLGPAGLDMEGLACLGDGWFAIATESNNAARTSDLVLVGRLAGGEVAGAGSYALTYPDDLAPTGNSGLEGLCQLSDGSLLAVSEDTAQNSAGRYAVLFRYHPDTGETVHHRLYLTSDTGKVSALDCGAGKPANEVRAVERHFDVARLLRFQLPETAGADVTAQMVFDLAPLVREGENFEGMVWPADDRVLLVNDNDYGGQSGPTELTELSPIAAATALRRDPPD